MKMKKVLIVLLITAFVTLIGNWIGYKHTNPLEALPGILILVLIAFVSFLLNKCIPIKIPTVVYTVTLAVILTVPGVFFSAEIAAYTNKVNFLALCTPILAYAGIYTGKNLSSLKKTGWRIFVLSVVVMIGTYVCSAVIAEVVLKLIGQIP